MLLSAQVMPVFGIPYSHCLWGEGGGGGGVNRFSDRRISQKKLFGFRSGEYFTRICGSY